MSRKKSKHRQAVPAEILAEGSASTAIVEAAPDEVIVTSQEEGTLVEAPAAGVVARAPATPRMSKKFKKFKKSEHHERGAASDEVAADSDAAQPDGLIVAGAEPTADAVYAGAPSGEALAGEEVSADGDAVEGAAIHVELDPVAGEPLQADGVEGETLRADGADGVGHELTVRVEGVGDDVVGADVVDVVDVVGDDVVGDPITDEAGVEAALLPGALSAVQLRHLIEALIFATDKPVTLQRLRQLTRVADVTRIEAALAELHEDYKERGIALTQV
ncbi:hypothetical protein BH11MYX1_BH11MYX1_07800 [soil metagenome]